MSAGSGSINPGKREAFYSQYAQQMMVHFASLTEKLTVKQSNPVSSAPAANGGGVSAIDRGGLEDIASALENMDVLCGALDAFHQRLRGGIEGDGTSVPAQGQPTPSPFFPVRAGFLRVVRLRLVDTFGQILDLAGSNAQTNVDPKQITSSIPMELDAAPQLQTVAAALHLALASMAALCRPFRRRRCQRPVRAGRRCHQPRLRIPRAQPP